MAVTPIVGELWPLQRGFTTFSTVTCAKEYPTPGIGYCFPNDVDIEVTLIAVLPRTVLLASVVITVTSVANGVDVAWDGSAGGIQPGWSGSVNNSSTGFHDIRDYDVTPSTPFTDGDSITVDVTATDDLGNPMPTCSWTFCIEPIIVPFDLTPPGWDAGPDFGIPTFILNLALPGWDAGPDFGIPTLAGAISPPGWDAGPDFGVPVLAGAVSPPGWDAGPDFGVPTVARIYELQPPGWDAGPDFGTAILAGAVNVPGWDAGPDFGTPSVVGTIFPPGWDAGPDFGHPVFHLPLAVPGFDAGPDFGTPTITLLLSPPGWDAGPDFGAPSVSPILVPPGFDAGPDFGTPIIAGAVNPPGFDAGPDFGHIGMGDGSLRPPRGPTDGGTHVLISHWWADVLDLNTAFANGAADLSARFTQTVSGGAAVSVVLDSPGGAGQAASAASSKPSNVANRQRTGSVRLDVPATASAEARLATLDRPENIDISATFGLVDTDPRGAEIVVIAGIGLDMGSGTDLSFDIEAKADGTRQARLTTRHLTTETSALLIPISGRLGAAVNLRILHARGRVLLYANNVVVYDMIWGAAADKARGFFRTAYGAAATSTSRPTRVQLRDYRRWPVVFFGPEPVQSFRRFGRQLVSVVSPRVPNNTTVVDVDIYREEGTQGSLPAAYEYFIFPGRIAQTGKEQRLIITSSAALRGRVRSDDDTNGGTEGGSGLPPGGGY